MRNILVAAVLGVLPLMSLPASAQSFYCGDCNGDGIITILDSLEAAQHAVAILTIVSPEFEACDVQPAGGDGAVGVVDALLLAQNAAGLPGALLCTPPVEPVAILWVSAPRCVLPGRGGVSVQVALANPNAGDVDLDLVQLTFANPVGTDLAADYAVLPDPGNPVALSGSAVAVLDFDITVSPAPADGPVTVDADVQATLRAGALVADAAGAAIPAAWNPAILHSDFDSGAAGWVAGGEWELGNPGVLLPPTPGPTMFGTVIAGGYTPSSRSSLDSPVIDLRSVSEVCIELQMFRDFEEPDWDGGNVKASTDAGASWTLVTPVTPRYEGSLAFGFSNPLAGEIAWLGSGAGAFERVLLDATPFQGSEVQLRFDFGSDSYDSGHLGWYVDDIVVCDLSGLPPARAEDPLPRDGATDLTARPAGIELQWRLAAGADTYDVYLDTTAPPTTLIAGAITTPSAATPALAVSTTYHWRVDTTNAFGTTVGTVWSFTTGTSTTPPAVLINEIDTGAADSVELVNAGIAPIDLHGWSLELHAAGAENGTFFFPAGTVLDPGGYVVVSDQQVPPGFRFSTSFAIAWFDAGTGEIVLRDQMGNGVDYFAHNRTVFPSLPPDLGFTAVGGPLDLAGQGVGLRDDFVDSDDAADMLAGMASSERDRNPGQPLTLPAPRATMPSPADSEPDLFVSGFGNALSWDCNGTWTSFDVYLDTVSPPVTLWAGALAAQTTMTPPLMRSTTYHWRVDARNTTGVTSGYEWSFTTSAATAPPAVLLNEVDTGLPDFVEILNTDPGPVDITGWSLSCYNGGLDGVFVFPPGTIMQPFEFLVVQDGGTPLPGGFVTGFNMSWTDVSAGEVVLQMDSGDGVDFVGFNASSFPALPGDLVFTAPSPVSIAGPGFAARTSYVDTDSTADWESATIGTPGLENPSQPPTSLPGAPAAPQPRTMASGVLARPAGHRLAWTPGSGRSDSFDVFFDTVDPPVASLGSFATATALSPPLAVGTTYYWRVEAINLLGATPGPVWSFTTGTVVTSVIVINEIGTQVPDFIELLNTSASAVDLSGWTLQVINSGSIDGTFVIPGGTMLAPGALLVVADGALGGALVAPFNFAWWESGGTAECILADAAGVARDYLFSIATAGGPAPLEQPPATTFHRDRDLRQSPANVAISRTYRGDDDRASDFTETTGSPGNPNPGQ